MEKQLIIDAETARHKMKRLAYQVYESNYNEKAIILVGIAENGYVIAEILAEIIREISPLNVVLAKISINKKRPFLEEAKIDLDRSLCENLPLIIVDDVANSGKTLFYALQPFMHSVLKKVQVAVFVDRMHKAFPVSADFVGHSLATTLKDHIKVEINENKEISAWLQ